MRKLVICDEEDKRNWQAIVDAREETKMGNSTPQNLQKLTTQFWLNMIDKYRILYNKRIAINQSQGYIFEWESPSELAKYK